MMKTLTRYLVVTWIAIMASLTAGAQFYNGLQMDFGKNRVQYEEFVWQFYRVDKFDTYFYVGGKELADYVGITASDQVKELETFLGYVLEKRIIFIVYNNLSDFRQSNLGLVSGNDQYNIGGTTKIIDNKVFLYFEGDHNKFREQIKAAVAEVIINEMLYGSDFKTRVANSTLLALPEWYIQGLIAYLSMDWNVEVESFVRDGILSGKYDKFNRLTGRDALYAGHSIWYYISAKYGRSVIPNILYLTRISKNSESGFLYVLGTPMKYLASEWLTFFDNRFAADEQRRTPPGEEKLNVKTKKSRVYQELETSPDGKWNAWVTNEMGQYRVWLAPKDGRPDCIYKREKKLDQITDFSYPLIAWHPTSLILTFITEEKGTLWLHFYDMETGKLSQKEMFNLEKITSYSFSHDGFNLVMSGLRNGATDIFVYNNPASTYTQITNDLADDKSPRFVDNSTRIVFVSNRLNDTLGVDVAVNSGKNFWDLFVYDYKSKNPVLTRITRTKYTNETMPIGLGKDEFLFLSDESGIVNIQYARFDSAISYIDTTTHYRYFARTQPLTDFPRNILSLKSGPGSTSAGKVYFQDGKYALYSNPEDIKNGTGKTGMTFYRKEFLKGREKADSLAQVEAIRALDTMKVIINPDTLVLDTNNININNYTFNYQYNRQKGYLQNRDTSLSGSGNDPIISFRPRMYLTSFYTNSFVGQVDFGFLNNSYQAFTGGAVYFNPGFNVFFKIGTNDLFENYKITGGFRFAGNFDSNEYLLSLENLNKRLDKQWVFHRIAFLNALDNALVKTHTHELYYMLRYPFNQVMAVRFTGTVRYDRGAYLSTDLATLRRENDIKTWGGVKGEWIYDDTRFLGVNLYYGTRGKVFAEAYHQLDEKQSDLWVLGFDFRRYTKIHRELIWASRIAGSKSFGHRRLVYYMGGVDNWINLSTRIPTFDASVMIDKTQNFVFQALATNLRGFSQNIRNGNNFVVFNNELRWPVIKYITRRPINSDFLENFQIIGFLDIGSAWSGDSPYDKKNAYNTEIIHNGPLTITIDKDRNPFVYGYGFGLRSRLLGYFVRADWAWGVENNVALPKIFYLSLSLDF